MKILEAKCYFQKYTLQVIYILEIIYLMFHAHLY